MNNSFIIPGKLFDLNELLKMHRNTRVKEKKKQEEIVKIYAKKYKLKKFEKPVNIHLTFFENSKRKDADNVIGGGQKIILDGLVNGGYLFDDGRKHVIQIIPFVYTDKDNPRIIVKIEEI